MSGPFDGLENVLPNPLLLLLVGPMYLGLSLLGMLQFQFLFQGLVQIGRTPITRHELWMQFVQPYLKNIANNLERLLGSADKFKPNFTHVLLLAILFVLISVMERKKRS
eukprot:TRINITY_DN17039_c0_g1_i3.p4 TRINITY_DN17039_c0_g1~~TRINITY_DN17039_c0_g1_i3.p4  ORF type:complete len:109 (-),score=5.94 TRINITY_DN17039_c0_g1_i3:503-829(-)